MKIFTSPKLILVPLELVEKAQAFAKEVVPTVRYEDSNQFNKKKIQNDHFVSKIGEEAVRLLFEQYEKKVEGPDYTIYKGKNKSWEEDLVIDGLPLAVKTQKKSAALKYGLSWTFQFSGYRKDPVLKSPEAWVCFVEYNDVYLNKRNQTHFCKVFPPYKIKELVFREPKLPYLKGKKKVVYAEDFKKVL